MHVDCAVTSKMKVWAVVFITAFWSAGTQNVPTRLEYRPGQSEMFEAPSDIEGMFWKLLAEVPLEPQETEYLETITSFLDRPKTKVKSFNVCDGPGCPTDNDCKGCRTAFSVFTLLVRTGWPEHLIIKIGECLCSTFIQQSIKVCTGIIRLNIPILAYIVRNTPEVTAKTFCALFLQESVNSKKCPMGKDLRFEWTINLPEYCGTKKPKRFNDDLEIALITDAHIDPYYVPGGVADCDEPTCCRKGQRPKQNNSAPAGYWGDYRNCDMPLWTYHNVIDEIDDQHKIDVLYYIGDTIDHHIWETSYDLIRESHRRIVKKIKKNFGDKILAFMAVGNHESQPTNQFAPPSITDPRFNTTWLYNTLADQWKDYLDSPAEESLRKTGSYSMMVRPGFRVISLNNNLAYRLNWWVMYDPSECKKLLEWLVTELHEAEQAGERVHILGHIPPGMEDFIYVWTREYNRIVNRFKHTIAGEFNGHTHEDGFKIFFDPDAPAIATSMAWNGGGITTYSDLNLNYKILTVDPSSYDLIQMRSYIFNLTEANLTPKVKPRWFSLYDWPREFGLKDLSANSMSKLTHRMVTSERELLNKYASYTLKKSDVLWGKCKYNDTCKIETLCETVVTVLWQREKCTELMNII